MPPSQMLGGRTQNTLHCNWPLPIGSVVQSAVEPGIGIRFIVSPKEVFAESGRILQESLKLGLGRLSSLRRCFRVITGRLTRRAAGNFLNG